MSSHRVRSGLSYDIQIDIGRGAGRRAHRSILKLSETKKRLADAKRARLNAIAGMSILSTATSVVLD